MTDHDGSTIQRMLAGEPYRWNAELAAVQRRAEVLCMRFNSMPAGEERKAVLAELLGAIGPGTAVRPPFWCDYGSHIRLGSGTFVNFGLVALDVNPITVGDDVQIGPYVQLLTANHPVEPGPRRDKWESGAPITIGDNAWLGGGVIVLGGTTIGADTVVGAGSVVARDLPAGVVAVGSPARVVRTL
jgi:maltose O-acetyltransferase